MADLNRKIIFDLPEIELLAKINNWKMNTCGFPPESKMYLWIKESRCRSSQLPAKLVLLNKMTRILKRNISEMDDQAVPIFLQMKTLVWVCCSSFGSLQWVTPSSQLLPAGSFTGSKSLNLRGSHLWRWFLTQAMWRKRCLSLRKLSALLLMWHLGKEDGKIEA